jgi:hypothetical protein
VYLKLACDLVRGIMDCQTRGVATIQLMWGKYSAARELFMKTSAPKMTSTAGVFEAHLDKLDPLLVELYKAMDHQDKTIAKAAYINTLSNVKQLLQKNWGNWSVKLVTIEATATTARHSGVYIMCAACVCTCLSFCNIDFNVTSSTQMQRLH